jgi:hypothetical protein
LWDYLTISSHSFDFVPTPSILAQVVAAYEVDLTRVSKIQSSSLLSCQSNLLRLLRSISQRTAWVQEQPGHS